MAFASLILHPLFLSKFSGAFDLSDTSRQFPSYALMREFLCASPDPLNIRGYYLCGAWSRTGLTGDTARRAAPHSFKEDFNHAGMDAFLCRSIWVFGNLSFDFHRECFPSDPLRGRSSVWRGLDCYNGDEYPGHSSGGDGRFPGRGNRTVCVRKNLSGRPPEKALCRKIRRHYASPPGTRGKGGSVVQTV